MIREIEYMENPNPYARSIEYYQDTEVIGYLNYSLIYDRIEVDDFYVKEEQRQRGIGKKLMSYLVCIAINNHVVNITLEVRESNNIARNIYKNFGFREVALRKLYYGDENGILMEKQVMWMKDIYCLAIESSCDETSMSIIKNGTTEVETIVLSQIDIHKKFGGVVPEIASRSHIESITIVLDELLKKSKMSIDDIDIIGVTYGPGLIGSLLIGLQCAKTISLVTNKPLIPVHHIAGHIYANNLEKRLEFPLIALVVSGGHTDLVYMEKDYSFKKIGGTLDDAVGEAYDKVAKILGLDYPGGPKIDKLSKLGNDTYNLPYPLDDNTYNFSFSGIKSAVINLVHNEKQRGNEINVEDMCTTFQNRVVTVIAKKTMKALEEYNVKNLVMAGGVAANSVLREKLSSLCKEKNISFSVPRIKYCTDNAAMIGSAAYYAYQKGIIADLKLNAMATDTLYK